MDSALGNEREIKLKQLTKVIQLIVNSFVFMSNITLKIKTIRTGDIDLVYVNAYGFEFSASSNYTDEICIHVIPLKGSIILSRANIFINVEDL